MFLIAQKGMGIRLLKGFVVDVIQIFPKHKVFQNSPAPLENTLSSGFGKSVFLNKSNREYIHFGS